MIGRQSFVSVVLRGAAVLAAALNVLTVSAQSSYVIRWLADPAQSNKVHVELVGLKPATLATLRAAKWNSEQWQRLFSVYVDQDSIAAQLFLPPMLGSYRILPDVLRFDPQFPLQPGVRYRAVFRPDSLPGSERAERVVSTFTLPAAMPPSTTLVTEIFPSGDILPENLLKFYVHFSASMSRGGIYDHILLRHISGEPVELPFLQIDEELWDANMTRLTLFIDPGRIKRGVLPLEEVGPALEAGKKYQLVISSAWKDAAGSRLKDTGTKTFTVGPPDRDPPNPKSWKINPPKSQTRDPLTVAFSESMDRALALRLIQVLGNSGEPVPGTKAMDHHEQRWLFTPDAPWSPGPYALVTQTHIEDLAGNNIGKPFEVDLFDGVQRRLTNSAVTLPFSIR